MKKLSASLLVLIMIFALAACTAGEPASNPEPEAAEPVALQIFAAASMTETLNAIKAAYEAENENVELVLTLDSSGTLKTQIEEGAPCDLFISAAQKQMNQLEELNLVDTATRVDLLENKVALVVPEGNPKEIQSYEDLGTDKLSLIALGNSDVPVGQYSEEILTYMGLWEDLNDAKKITFGTNVKEVTSQVKEGTVDCGIVYGTDAAAAGLETVAFPPEGSHSPVVYPAAVMAEAANPEAAKAFLDYLMGDACSAVFEEAGFAIAH